MAIPKFIPKTLRDLATKGLITKSSLRKHDDITLSRAAWYYSSISKNALEKAILRFRGLSPLPLLPKVELYKHQLDIVKFMRMRETTPHSFGVKGGLVLAKMGLGKTLASIVCGVMYRSASPTLIVVPKSLLEEWRISGFEKFFAKGSLKVGYAYQGYNSIVASPLDYDFIVTTYDVCRGAYSNPSHPFRFLYEIEWGRVVCDESQRFRNSKRKTFEALSALSSDRKWCLTGTVIRNSPLDLLSQLRWCGLECSVSDTEWTRGITRYLEEYELDNVMLVVTYESAGIVLPDKITNTNVVALSGYGREVYDRVRGIAETKYEMAEAGKCSFGCVLSAFTYLRQISIAPYLITKESKRGKKKDYSPEMKAIVSGPLGKWLKNRDGEAGIGSPKMMKLLELSRDILSRKEKVVVFSMFNCALDLAEYLYSRNGIKVVKIDGSTSSSERAELLNLFKNSSEIGILLINYKIGGEGINLSEANNVVRLESWWSSSVHEQSEARCHRIGQTSTVYVETIVTEGTIEEKIVEVYTSKKELADSIIGRSNVKELTKTINRNIIRDMIRHSTPQDEEEYW